MEKKKKKLVNFADHSRHRGTLSKGGNRENKMDAMHELLYQSARSIQSPFWPAGGSPARDRRTAVLFPIEWNRRNKSADLEKESTAHYKVMQKLVKSAVFLYIFCEKKCSFLHISYIRQILAILRNRNTNIL